MIIQEVELELTPEKQVRLLNFFKEYYEEKIMHPRAVEEFQDVVSSVLSHHVPLVVEHIYGFTPGLLSIVPEIKEYMNETPDRVTHFVGWFSYDPNKPLFPETLTQAINDAVSDYSGPIYATDVWSRTHNQVGIILTSKKTEQADADAYFEDMLAQFYMGTEDKDDEFNQDRGDTESIA